MRAGERRRAATGARRNSGFARRAESAFWPMDSPSWIHEAPLPPAPLRRKEEWTSVAIVMQPNGKTQRGLAPLPGSTRKLGLLLDPLRGGPLRPDRIACL